MTFRFLKLTSEVKLILAFTIILWSFRAVFSFGFLFWRGTFLQAFPTQALLIALYIGVTLIVWFGLRLIKSWPLIITFLIAPFVAFAADALHSELFGMFRDEGLFDFIKTVGWKSYLYQTYLGSLFFLAWYMGYLAITLYFKFVRENVALVENRTQAQQAQLQMLRHQIDPHFLFNTLNSISSLVLDGKNQDAEKMINGLGQFLRVSFEKTDTVKITLREEIEIVKEYLTIEKIRFSDKLQTAYSLAPETLSCLVPSLILQPAVENALKHAISPKKSKGLISIGARVDDGTLILTVDDNGPGLSNGQAFHGVGVKNMRERLRALYGSAGQIKIDNQVVGGVRVQISCPVEHAPSRQTLATQGAQ